MGKNLKHMDKEGNFLNRTPIGYALRSRIYTWNLIKFHSFRKRREEEAGYFPSSGIHFILIFTIFFCIAKIVCRGGGEKKLYVKFVVSVHCVSFATQDMREEECI